MSKARLEELYKTKIRAQLKDTLKLSNIMEVPRFSKVVVNVGVKEAVGDSKALQKVIIAIEKITGQKPVRTKARKSIAGFKIREGMPLGVKVTLRKKNMYEFLDRLINLVLPQTRDFQGVTTKLDRRGNYNLGLKEWVIFPELSNEVTDKSHGLNITICTTTNEDAHAFELLKQVGMPFKKPAKAA